MSPLSYWLILGVVVSSSGCGALLALVVLLARIRKLSAGPETVGASGHADCALGSPHNLVNRIVKSGLQLEPMSSLLILSLAFAGPSWPFAIFLARRVVLLCFVSSLGSRRCRYISTPADMSAGLLSHKRLSLLLPMISAQPSWLGACSYVDGKAMKEQSNFQNRDGYEYARSLLRDRRQELQVLALRHRQKLTPTNDYLSCRRSLLEAIRELETLLGAKRNGTTR